MEEKVGGKGEAGNMDHYPLGFYKKSGSGPTESMGVLMGEWNALFAFSAVTLFACKSFK